MGYDYYYYYYFFLYNIRTRTRSFDWFLTISCLSIQIIELNVKNVFITIVIYLIHFHEYVLFKITVETFENIFLLLSYSTKIIEEVKRKMCHVAPVIKQNYNYTSLTRKKWFSSFKCSPVLIYILSRINYFIFIFSR